MAIDTLANPRHRFLNWSNPEFVQAVARLAIVGCAIAYAFSDYCLAHSPTLENVVTSKRVSLLSGGVAALILLWTIRSPASSLFRRLVGITHDTLAISIAMFLGVDANATFGVVYLVVIVGNGFRFGAPYMAYATACSMLGFGLVHELSPYWQSNPTLSFYIASILVVVPGYMYGLLNSLHRAREELEQRATHDHLTGLMNRAGIEQRILDTVGASPRGHVLMYMDLDRFKHVNDNAGHPAGDRLLKEIARVIKGNLRDRDVCARLGGDEFCMLLIDCRMDTATQIAERIREQVESFRLLWGGRVYSVGASIGVAASDSVEDGQSLLRLADAACYAAKNAGRNSVHVVDANQRISDTGLLRRLHIRE
jgi:diguanylate cyclase (GGDEF)-like protein